MKKLFLITFVVGMFLLLIALTLCGIGITLNLPDDGTFFIATVLCTFSGIALVISSAFAYIILIIMED